MKQKTTFDFLSLRLEREETLKRTFDETKNYV